MGLQHEHYSEEEAQEILRQAVARQAQIGEFGSEHAQPGSAGFSRADLERMAAELGVSPEMVRQVEDERRLRAQEAAAQEQLAADRKDFIRHQREDFRNHLVSFVFTNLALIFIDVFTSGHITWSIWPLFGWGIGLIFAARDALITGGDDFEKDFQKWRKKRAKRAKQDISDES